MSVPHTADGAAESVSKPRRHPFVATFVATLVEPMGCIAVISTKGATKGATKALLIPAFETA